MSLLNFVRQRLQDLHNEASAVGNVVHRDVAAPVSRLVNTVARPQPPSPIPTSAQRPVMPAPRPVAHVNPFIGGAHNLINFGSRAVNQVNPFDNGRTFQQRMPTNQGSVMHQITHNGVTNAAGDVVHSATNVVAAPVNVARGLASAYIEHNPGNALKDYALARRDAQNNLVTSVGRQAYHTVMGSIVDPAVQLLTPQGSVAHQLAENKTVSDLNQTPFGQLFDPAEHKAAEYQVYRDLPNLSKSEQKKVIAANEKTAGLDPNASLGKQVLTSGLAALQLSTGDKVVNGVPIKEDLAAKVATAKAAADAATKTVRGIAISKPFRSISDTELAAANRVSMQRAGYPDNTKPGDFETYRSIQQKLGIGPNDHQTVDNVIGARKTYEVRQAQRPSLLVSEGGGKGTRYNSSSKLPHENFEQEYADALKQMDNGLTGGQMVPDGEGGYTRTSEHTPFYRQVYANTGKPPTKAEWLAESQRQLQSGKGDSYAQAEYDDLKAATAKSVKPVAATALRRSTAADAPTSINDLLLAKKVKLDAIQAKTVTAPEAQTITAFADNVPMNEVHVDATGKQVVSKFPARLAKEERTAPIASDLQDVATHQQLHNQDVLAATGANIAQDENGALAFAKRGNSTEANATALQLIDKYLSEGQFEKAGDLTKTVSPRFTRQGQETQILATYSKLTPAGAVRFAQHEVDKVANKTPKGKRLEDETNTTAKTLKKTTDEVANQLDTEIKNGKLGTQKSPAGSSKQKSTKTGKSPEERLAARIKASETKKTKGPDPITDMVNTLHKVVKEVLPADEAKSVPRDPMQLIGQAVKGEGNYQDVYAKAKTIVMDRYKDNPEAQSELERYFSDDPKRTYAQSQVNAGVQSGLKGVDLGTLVKQHYTTVNETGKDLKTTLIERAGLSNGEAAQLAGDIQKRYNELIQARKDSIIKQIFGDKPTPKQSTAADKIFQYENLGALSKDELRPLVGEKLGVPSLSADAVKEISGRADAIQQMPEGIERNRATAEMLRFIANQVPQNKVQGVLSIWKAGLLSGAKTQSGNLVSNATFGALHKISDIPAAGLDTVLSKFTGKRTKTFTTRGIASGTAEGVSKGMNTLRSGLDERNFTGNKFDVYGELNFKNPVIQNIFGKPSNFVFRGMSAADQPFYYAQAKNSLTDMARAEAKNRGLNGDGASEFVKNSIANPTPEMAERAKHEAEQAVLSQESRIASSLTHLAQNHPTVQILVPFIKVPTNFLTRTLDYTPAGAIKVAVKIMQNRRAGVGFDQRAFVTAVGEATTGSAVLYLGAEMANHNLLSGAFPSDPKEQQRWKTQGITPNSIHIGNKWISLNYLGPLGLLLNAGRSYHDAAGAGNSGWTQALASFGQNLAGQSFLSGFNNFANALQDPKRYLNTLVNSEAGSVVPAWANDLANALDSKQRQPAGPGQTIQSRLPGVRNDLPQKTDVYGNGLPQRTNALQLTGDPTRPSNNLGGNNSVIQEVARLHNVAPNNTDLQVTPTPPTSLNIEGKTVKLSADQKYQLQNKVGQAVQSKWGPLIKTSEYKSLSNIDKAKALSNLRSDVTTLVERQFVVDNNLGVYTKSPSRAVQALGQDQTTISDYATKTQNNGASGVILNKKLDSNSHAFLTKYNALNTKQRDNNSYSQNGFDYQVAQAKYANDVANNSLSKAGKIKAQAALSKGKVGASYSRDVRDLYGLSNDELSRWLSANDPGVDKGKLAKQIIAYGDALATAGVITKNKFRTSKGVLTLGEQVPGGSRSSAAGPKMKTVAIPGIKSNPYRSASSKKQTFKQIALPKIKSTASHHSYKVAALKTNINSKLRKA